MENNEKIWDIIQDYSWDSLSSLYLKKAKKEQAFELQMTDFKKNYKDNVKGISAILGELFVKELENILNSDDARLIFDVGNKINIPALMNDVKVGIGELLRLPISEIANTIRENQKDVANMEMLLSSFILYNRGLSRTEAMKKLQSHIKRSREYEKKEMEYLYGGLLSQLEKCSDKDYEETKRIVIAGNQEQ